MFQIFGEDIQVETILRGSTKSPETITVCAWSRTGRFCPEGSFQNSELAETDKIDLIRKRETKLMAENNENFEIDSTNYLKEKKFDIRQPREEDLMTTQEKINDRNLQL